MITAVGKRGFANEAKNITTRQWRLLAVEDKQVDVRVNIGISGYPEIFPHNMKKQVELMIGYQREAIT